MNVSGQIYIPADLTPGEEPPLPIEWKDGMDIVAMRRISACAEKQTPVVQRETRLTHLYDKCITRGRMSNI
jgi:hypothetical protein